MAGGLGKPSILFVHGACHIPDIHYCELLRTLENNGFDVFAPRLPTNYEKEYGHVGLADDATFIRTQALNLINQGRYLLIVCHSYGGMVITSGLSSDLNVNNRQSVGKPGGILHLFYLCALIPLLGESMMDVVSKHGSLLELDVDEEGYGKPKNAIEAFYNDIDLVCATSLTEKLVKHPVQASATPVSNISWRYFPITYVFCTLDKCVLIECQREMIRKLEAFGKSDISVNFLESGHSPFLSKTMETAALIQDAWDHSITHVRL